ncbi:MAG: hypothetical protein IJY42_03610 [Clostridia bacterium]|nr:hypothetical protein [Clostridia bacterium]
MKNASAIHPKRLPLFAVIALGMTLLCTVLRCVSLFLFYDGEAGYYAFHTALPVVTTVIQVLSVAALLLFALFGFSKEEAPLPVPSFGARLTALLPAAAILFVSVYSLISNEAASFVTVLPFEPAILFVLSFILSIAAAAFFLLLCCAQGKQSWVRASLLLTGIAGLLFFAVRLAISYFHFGVRMNAPMKLTVQICCLTAMLLLLSELRITGNEQKPRFSLFATGAAVLLLGSTAIPSLAAQWCGVLGTTHPLWPMDVVSVALFVYSFVRLVQICRLSAKRQAEQTPLEEDTGSSSNPDSTSESSNSEPSEETN